MTNHKKKTTMAEAEQESNNTYAPNYDSDVTDRNNLGELAKIAAKVIYFICFMLIF